MTECYAMVRGSVLRTTALSDTGLVTSPVYYFVSKSAVKVTIEEISESSSGAVYRGDDDTPRMSFPGKEDIIGFEAAIDFLKVDPAILVALTGQEIVLNGDDDIVGFDVSTRVPAVAFALEAWTRLDRPGQWGYTLFPFLRGGLLSGFVVADGLVSFSVRRAQTRPGTQWLVGPYDLEGQYERLLSHVSGNDAWRTAITYTQPPDPFDGVQEIDDRIKGGSVDVTTPDILAGGDATYTSPWIISGGRA